MNMKCNSCSKMFTDAQTLADHKRSQHPAKTPNEDELDAVARESLWAFLTSDGTDRGLLAKAKQANAYRSTEARREQTAGAKEATLIMMARELAEDKTEFRKLMKIALPASPMVKQITR